MNAAGQVALAKALLGAMPGAAAEPARVHGVTIYKLMGKMFAILSARGDAAVSLKCDPHRADLLREQYSGMGIAIISTGAIGSAWRWTGTCLVANWNA